MDALPSLILPAASRTPEQCDRLDLYLPDDVSRPRPAVLVVHGGPVPAEVRPRPFEWPLFQGYAAHLAARGLVAGIVDHRLHSPTAYPVADQDVHAAAALLRADQRVDADRVALWFFSGGSLLSAPWLAQPPAWLRCVALTYPLLAPVPGWEVDPAFRPSHGTDLPVLLTRVGREQPVVAEGVAAFVAGTTGNLSIIDVPNGRHSFDHLDDTDESRAAITRALDFVVGWLA